MQMFSSQQDLQTNLEYIRKAGVAHMMTVYKTDNRVLHEVEEMDPGVWIMMTNPTMEESQEVAEKYDIYLFSKKHFYETTKNIMN